MPAAAALPPPASVGGADAPPSADVTDEQLRAWLQTQVLEGTHVPLTFPPAQPPKPHAKPDPVPEGVLQRLLPPDMLSMYESSILRCFLSESECWQPCPRPGCQFAVHCLDPHQARPLSRTLTATARHVTSRAATCRSRHVP